MIKHILTSGKRKRAIARATLRQGNGIVKINHLLLDAFEPKVSRMRIMEPLILGEKFAQNADIDVSVSGGGQSSQAEAARLAIGKALLEFSESNALKEEFLKYDRQLLVADVRRKEACKPNDSKARKKRQKSYR